jgi:hypothetical protein
LIIGNPAIWKLDDVVVAHARIVRAKDRNLQNTACDNRRVAFRKLYCLLGLFIRRARETLVMGGEKVAAVPWMRFDRLRFQSRKWRHDGVCRRDRSMTFALAAN